MPNWSAPLERTPNTSVHANRNCVVEVRYNLVSTRAAGFFYINEVLHQQYANEYAGNNGRFWWYIPAGTTYRTENTTQVWEYPLIGA